MVLTGLVGPGSVCVGCPLGNVRCDCGSYHYFTIFMLTTSIIMYYHVLLRSFVQFCIDMQMVRFFSVGCQI